jgi:hypothetical protein
MNKTSKRKTSKRKTSKKKVSTSFKNEINSLILPDKLPVKITHIQRVKNFLYKYRIPLSALVTTVSGVLILKKVNSGKQLTPKEQKKVEKISVNVSTSTDNVTSRKQGVHIDTQTDDIILEPDHRNIKIPAPPPPRLPPPPPPPPPPPKRKDHTLKIIKGNGPKKVISGPKPPSLEDILSGKGGLKKVVREDKPKVYEEPALISQIKKGGFKLNRVNKNQVPTRGLSSSEIKQLEKDDLLFNDENPVGPGANQLDFGKRKGKRGIKFSLKIYKNDLKKLKKIV